MREIILNRIITPDGTELISFHRHDFASHWDINGHTYSVDGGHDYLKRVGPSDYTEASIYSDAPFEEIRENYYRAHISHNFVINEVHLPFMKRDSYNTPFLPLSHIGDRWLENIIIYNRERGIDGSWYLKEKEYRTAKNISIED